MRSLLFVPGDSARKFARGRESAADALILDLEDSVADGAKEQARQETARLLQAERGRQRVFVRVNAFDTPWTAKDLAAIMPFQPHGIVLPKCDSPDQVRRLDHMLDAFEAVREPTAAPAVILPIATETAASLFSIGSYRGCSERLAGLIWGAEDLAASLGSAANRHEGRLLSPFQLARDLCLAGAATAGVMAIDTVATAIDDLEALRLDAHAARRDGFQGKAIIHPTHAEIVNAAFSPSDAEVAWARRVVQAFERQGGLGAVRIEGQMIDKPHIRAAERILNAIDRA